MPRFTIPRVAHCDSGALTMAAFLLTLAAGGACVIVGMCIGAWLTGRRS